MPGGPYTPRPDLGPGVGFGSGLPQPGQGGGYYGPSIESGFDPVTGQMTAGTHDFGRFYPGAPPSMSQSLGLDFGNPGMGGGPAFGATGQAVLQSGSNNPAPIQGMPTSGMGDGKASDMGRMAGNMLGQGIPNMFGGENPSTMESPRGPDGRYLYEDMPPPNDPSRGGPQMIGGAYGQPIYGSQPNPMPPNMYS